MHVELAASPLDLARLGNRVREAWTHMGVARPHHSVLSGRDYLPQFINKDSIDRFYASGAREAATINTILRRHGFCHPESKICVEYGCGLGRVTFALANIFKKVHGYDISTTHLTSAERHASDTGIHNIDFHLCSADLVSKNLEDCDFFYSRIVFQHNPPPLMRELIATSLKSLRPGGVAIFQVPTYGAGYAFRIQEYLASSQQLDMEMHCIPQSEVFKLIVEAHCKILEVREDRSIGRLGQWISNTFVVERLTCAPARMSTQRRRKLVGDVLS
jgi:SAM-dependent methyltransferase